MRLVFDTETSGLPKAGPSGSVLEQPNMAALGAVLFDGNWKPVAKLVTLIKPDGWSIEPEAEAVHGISTSRAAKYGIPLVAALAAFQGLQAAALQLIAHNAAFDRGVIGGELERLEADGLWWAKRAAAIVCTMELSTKPCGLPGPYGLKFPSLEEAHRRFFPEHPYTTKHEVEDDLMATSRVAQALQREGVLPSPSIRPGPPPIDTSWRRP